MEAKLKGIRKLGVAVGLAVISGCGFMEQVGLHQESSSATTDSSAIDMPNVTSKRDGVFAVAYDPNSNATQLISTGIDGEIAGASITLPPGTLGIETEVSLEEGVTLPIEEIKEELGLSGDDFVASGPAVVISTTQTLEATNPFTIAIPYNPAISLAESDTPYLVILYRTLRKDGSVRSGVIPNSKFAIKENTVELRGRYFGSYMVARASKQYLEIIDQPSFNQTVEKSAKHPFGGRWSRLKCDNTKGSDEDGWPFSRAVLTVSKGLIHHQKTEGIGCGPSTQIMRQVAYYGAYEMPTVDQQPHGPRDINVTFNAIKVRYFTDDGISELKTKEACNLKTWEKEKWMEVPNSVCMNDSSGNVTKQDFDVKNHPQWYTSIKLDGENLFIAEKKEVEYGTDESNRSVTFNESDSFSRKQPK